MLQNLAPQTDAQRSLKAQAVALAADLGQMRWLLFEQAGSSISTPLLVIVVFWLAILFFSFGLFGPTNTTAVGALVVAALLVSGAIFLVLELDQPFNGLIRISSQPMVSALSQLAASSKANGRRLETQMQNLPRSGAKDARGMGAGLVLALSALVRGPILGRGAGLVSEPRTGK